MALRRSIPLAAAFFLVIVTAGCGESPSTLSPVRGTVRYRGQPLPAGTIVFTPDITRGYHGAMATGIIQPDGTYSLATEDGPGAAPGWYCVTVVAIEAAPKSDQPDQFIVPRSLLPRRYRDPEQSGLTCEVKAGQENQIDLHLD